MGRRRTTTAAPRRPRGRQAAARPARLAQRLVLHDWMVRHVFEADSSDDLLDVLKGEDAQAAETAWIGEDGISLYHHRLARRLPPRQHLTDAALLRYDEHVVRHWRAITGMPERRNLSLKHFQYLALVFTEYYLDRYFASAAGLLADLNAYVDEWNASQDAVNQAEPFRVGDLNKLAFWMATGSGKTLLMHVHIRQYLHYLEAAGRRHELNRIILLTPNEGLSLQHLDEFALSGIDAALFSKDGRTLFTGSAVEVIDIHKLAEDAGDKTVAVESFEGNNLVLVDEGHRGSSSERGAWMTRRRQLCRDGFSFEYSATFGQAIKPGTADRGLMQEYSHCILFDYSYRFFHRDGYGKDFQILNLQEQQDAGQQLLYMTGGLLAYLQQLRVYDQEQAVLAPYGLERPLWVFVGSRVTASTGTQEVSDILAILQFLDRFLADRAGSTERIDSLRQGAPGLTDGRGRPIFGGRFRTLFAGGRTAAQVYDDALTHLFNAPAGGGLHLEQLQGPDASGEIALRVGGHEPFGVVNVGDASKVVRQAREAGLDAGEPREFAGSLFRGITSRESTINLLIGAKKFTEGWSTWRVSTMGLMNVGRSEGSEIIQLFGRGVRLRGLGFSLKRSGYVRREDGARHPEEALALLETLNVFGIRADYMQQFREFLEEEGVITDDDVDEIILRVVNHLEPAGKYAAADLFTLAVEEGRDFKRDGAKPRLAAPAHPELRQHPVTVDWYPRIQARQSEGVGQGATAVEKHPGKLGPDQLAFLDFDRIWLALEQFKAEKSWHNLAIPREGAQSLLGAPDWYTLLIDPDELRYGGWEHVRLWEEIAIALLKKYCERFYALLKADYEKEFLRYEPLTSDGTNMIKEYRFTVPRVRKDILDALEELQLEVEEGVVTHHNVAGNFIALDVQGHLYTPLIYVSPGAAEVSPVALKKSEHTFVRHLTEFLHAHRADFGDAEIYLLRNQSRARGIGFFESGGFYPDFILWVKDRAHQRIAFVDPKGLRNLDGPNDPKVTLATRIKEQQARLAASQPGVTLDSFLVSETPQQQVQWGESLTDDAWEEAHILFPGPDPSTHIRRMFELMHALHPSA